MSGHIQQTEASTPEELKEITDSGIEFRILERSDGVHNKFYPQVRKSLAGIKYWSGLECDQFSFYDPEWPDIYKFTSTKSKALGTILEYVRASRPAKVHSIVE